MSRDQRVPDQDQRDAAVAARGRNVMIDAGAGTGKTATLVSRLVGMVAPEDGSPAVTIERIAAITFTRRAAGELRLRIRERILSALAAISPDAARAEALRGALAGLDTAAIGTIHSFADRLLRQKPVETRLSPEYEIHEEDDALIAEAADVLLASAQAGTLPAELAGAVDESVAIEAQETIVSALVAGIRLESQEHEWGVRYGLDGLIEGFLRNRDVRPRRPEAEPFDLQGFRVAVAELRQWVEPLVGDASGIRWLRRVARLAAEAAQQDDPVSIYRRVVMDLSKSPSQKTKGDGFASNDAAWDAWKAYDGDSRKNPVRSRPLRDDILDPLRRWLATRLVGLFPVAAALYERVKARHRAVDQIDLLLKLRDLLRDDHDARSYYQSLFDHVFIDEFQDTDPLQAEIVLYLCEAGAQAESWGEVRLAPGKLTIVGDAKQSIYRFRRADVAMYDQVRRQIAESDHLACTLSANFRSLPSLIRWLNDRFPEVLGQPPESGQIFDTQSGRVYYQPLLEGRPDDSAPTASAPVHVVPYDVPAGATANAENCRDTEGVALSRYIRWIVDNPAVEITDEDTRERRMVTYGDVAVLALSTWDLHRLFSQLDREGIPHATRGGTLFLSDALHRRFLLALRAIADRDDGPANAALLRPPFFAIDPLDLLLERDAPEDSTEPRVRRAREAHAIVREIRRDRFARPPGETARDLIERTALGGYVARQPNGAQRLRHLREICHVLEQTAVAEGLDYDRATVRLRHWVGKPAQLDPPLPIGTDAVQVLTVHQAKGLEFPVVVLWDGRAGKASIDRKPAWRIARDAGAWAIGLEGLAFEYPPSAGIAEQEGRYRDEERRRLVYVAATRARDVLVLPRAPGLSGKNIHGWFVSAPEGTLTEPAIYRSESEPEWARPQSRSGDPAPAPLDQTIEGRWRESVAAAAQAHGRAVAVTTAARVLPGVTADAREPTSGLTTGTFGGPPSDELATDADGRAVPAPPGPPEERDRTGRHGPLFGTAVHRAIALALRSPDEPLPSVVGAAAARAGLTEHLAEAEADVARTLETLRRLGLLGRPDLELRLEYPIAGAGPDGALLSGFIDLIAASPEELHVIDFKTDVTPGAAGPPRHYGRQLRLYSELLERAGIVGPRRVLPALLYTIDGSVHAV